MRRWFVSAKILGHTPADIAVLLAVFAFLACLIVLASALPPWLGSALLSFFGLRPLD